MNRSQHNVTFVKTCVLLLNTCWISQSTNRHSRSKKNHRRPGCLWVIISIAECPLSGWYHESRVTNNQWSKNANACARWATTVGGWPSSSIDTWSVIASQIIGNSTVCAAAWSNEQHRKHQRSSEHPCKWSAMRKASPCYTLILIFRQTWV